MNTAPVEKTPTIALLGPDPAFLATLATVFAPVQSVTPVIIGEPVENAARDPQVTEAALVVVDLGSPRRESLSGLQTLMARLGGQIPVIVLTDAFDDGLARWFLQIRVADFLRKPVQPQDVLRACVQALRAGSGLPDHGGETHAFLPAIGGAGTTTLAIEAAMLLIRNGKEPSTCLVDLDLENGSCADYLDIDPRLNPDDIGPHLDRLDQQLLAVMLSQHASGLTVLAAPSRPAQLPTVGPDFILRLLDLVSARFEHVVIDMPRRWDPWTDSILAASNHVYVVTDMTVPGLRHGRKLAAAVAERMPDISPQVIVNRFQPTSLFGTGLRRSDAERALGPFLAGTVANNYALVREAIDRGLPLESVKAGSNVSTDLRRIVLSAGPRS